MLKFLKLGQSSRPRSQGKKLWYHADADADGRVMILARQTYLSWFGKKSLPPSKCVLVEKSNTQS